MNTIHEFTWLARQTLSAFFLFKAFTIAALVLLLASIFIGSPIKDQRTKVLAPWSILMLAFPVLYLCIGALFRHQAHSAAPASPMYLLYFISVINILAAVIFIAKSNANRFRAIAISINTVYWSYLCLFVPSMAVTNDWL